MKVLIALTAFFGIVYSAKLAPYIEICQDGPGLNDCAVTNANKAIPFLAKGDPKFKVPVMDPMEIKELSITETPGKSMSVNLTFMDVKLTGLKNAKFVKSDMDTKKKHFVWTVDAPMLNIRGKYKINGKILVLPILGDGPMEITLQKPRLTYTLDYDHDKRNGETYMKITKTKLIHTVDGLSLKFENLFNGDKNLGENMNLVLNENWKEVNSQLAPAVGEGINLLLKRVLEGCFKDVAMKDIVKPQ